MGNLNVYEFFRAKELTITDLKGAKGSYKVKAIIENKGFILESARKNHVKIMKFLDVENLDFYQQEMNRFKMELETPKRVLSFYDYIKENKEKRSIA